jgi:hypothetical protein
MAPKAFGQKRTNNERVRSELFVSRRNKQQLLSFVGIDPALLVTCLDVAMQNGTTISFAPAQGGIGITLRVYRGDYADNEFAGSPEELTELLTLLTSGLYQGGDDPVEVTRLAMSIQARSGSD